MKVYKLTTSYDKHTSPIFAKEKDIDLITDQIKLGEVGEKIRVVVLEMSEEKYKELSQFQP